MFQKFPSGVAIGFALLGFGLVLALLSTHPFMFRNDLEDWAAGVAFLSAGAGVVLTFVAATRVELP